MSDKLAGQTCAWLSDSISLRSGFAGEHPAFWDPSRNRFAMAEVGPAETLTNVWTLCEEAMTLLDMISLQERPDGNGIVCIQLRRRWPTGKKQSCGA